MVERLVYTENVRGSNPFESTKSRQAGRFIYTEDVGGSNPSSSTRFIFLMYYTYILSSKIRKFFYTGCTDDLKERVLKHNEGKVRSTKPYAPFDLVYYEACLDIDDAYKRESI